MIEANENDYLLPKEVAALLHVSPKTVARWATQQKLPYVKTLGGHRRFPAGKITALVRRLEAEGRTLDD
ncbi:MAG TPA: helix-turn-helix domain-containing protein [Actinomycetota bacterium]|nr:helix-turn-helix domain-containing protein [Actinomycetota bacterium]